MDFNFGCATFVSNNNLLEKNLAISSDILDCRGCCWLFWIDESTNSTPSILYLVPELTSDPCKSNSASNVLGAVWVTVVGGLIVAMVFEIFCKPSTPSLYSLYFNLICFVFKYLSRSN